MGLKLSSVIFFLFEFGANITVHQNLSCIKILEEGYSDAVLE
jgi:hypothetical protein